MISRFENATTAAGDSQEAWTGQAGNNSESGNTWCSCPGGYIYNQYTPTMVTLLMTGTTGSVTANVKWRLHTTGSCNDGDEYTIDSRNFALVVNEPFRPLYVDWYLPSNIPVGDYELCAIIDAPDDVSETVETADNEVYSEKTFRITNNCSCN